MPNWVTNELVLKGPGDMLETAQAMLGDADAEEEDQRLLDFSRLIAEPDDLPWSEGDDWRTEHWGSKWNASSVSLAESPITGLVRYTFETAWTPAIPLLAIIATKFPALSIDFAFIETSELVAGRIRYANDSGWIEVSAAGDADSCVAVLEDSHLASPLSGPPRN